MRFVQLDLDTAFTHDPQAKGHAGRRLLRLIAGNPVTTGEMTRHAPDAGSYAPITILIEEMRRRNPGRVRQYCQRDRPLRRRGSIPSRGTARYRGADAPAQGNRGQKRGILTI